MSQVRGNQVTWVTKYDDFALSRRMSSPAPVPSPELPPQPAPLSASAQAHPMATALARMARFCAHNAFWVIAVCALLMAGGVAAIGTDLGVSTDTGKLFSKHLPWRVRQLQMEKAFPRNQDTLIAVVSGTVPEAAEAAADGLEHALVGQKTLFKYALRPDSNAYLRRNALMFLSPDKLEPLLDNTIAAQPFLGQLAADPSARGLFGALGLIADGISAGQGPGAGFDKPLEGFAGALHAAADGHPAPLSWQRLLTGDLADMAGKYRFVITQPKLDYGSFAPGGKATDAMKAAIAALPEVKSGLAEVHITGQVALDDQEFATVAQGAVKELIGSLLVVLVWLFLAVRSWRFAVPILIVLLFGLLMTTAFATLAVGTLNLISVAFAILFVGIAVDFGIQFSVRFREYLQPSLVTTGRRPKLRATNTDRERALGVTARRAGTEILIAALATAAGFLGFTPTAFIGVAQLGLIAGVGMMIAFLSTLTLLPALLRVFHPRAARAETGFRLTRHVDGPIARAHRFILAGAGIVAFAGLVLLPKLSFDGDPLHTQSPDAPAVKTLNLLLTDPLTTPYSADILRPDLRSADALAARLRTLPEAGEVLTLSSFVPQDQDKTLPMIADAASLLLPTLSPPEVKPAPDAAALRASAQAAADKLAAVRGRLPPGSPLAGIADDLARLAKAPDSLLMATNDDLVRYLPAQLATLRDALAAKPVGLADVPGDMKRDWQLPDGRSRVNVTVHAGEDDNAGLHAFTAAVRQIAPDATGTAFNIVESAATVVHAFEVAALSALVAIAVLLLITLRRVSDAARVMAPLLLSALATVICSVLLPLPLNFANIIALPLLLGVGVSFNIYFVMNWRHGETKPLASPTMRAIFFSALTTATAFGSLALSKHPGTASMGELLLLSLAATLASTLLFVPAMLAASGKQPVDPTL